MGSLKLVKCGWIIVVLVRGRCNDHSKETERNKGIQLIVAQDIVCCNEGT